MKKIPYPRLANYRVKVVKEKTNILLTTDTIQNPEDAAKLMREYIGLVDREHFVMLLLNAMNKVDGIHTVSIGVLTGTMFHAREVFKTAILGSACSIVLGHNHPSGSIQPSKEDLEMTKKLSEVGELVGIKMVDSLIVTEESYWSAAENGFVK
ncbi:MAG: JAB domain-containing protein [bacterium]